MWLHFTVIWVLICVRVYRVYIFNCAFFIFRAGSWNPLHSPEIQQRMCLFDTMFSPHPFERHRKWHHHPPLLPFRSHSAENLSAMPTSICTPPTLSRSTELLSTPEPREAGGRIRPARSMLDVAPLKGYGTQSRRQPAPSGPSFAKAAVTIGIIAALPGVTPCDMILLETLPGIYCENNVCQNRTTIMADILPGQSLCLQSGKHSETLKFTLNPVRATKFFKLAYLTSRLDLKTPTWRGALRREVVPTRHAQTYPRPGRYQTVLLQISEIIFVT